MNNVKYVPGELETNIREIFVKLYALPSVTREMAMENFAIALARQLDVEHADRRNER